VVKASLASRCAGAALAGLGARSAALSSCNWGASARSFSGKVIRKKVSNQVKNSFVDNFIPQKHKIYFPMFAKQNVDYNEAVRLCLPQ
jgi:hypothetical protein